MQVKINTNHLKPVLNPPVSKHLSISLSDYYILAIVPYFLLP